MRNLGLVLRTDAESMPIGKELGVIRAGAYASALFFGIIFIGHWHVKWLNVKSVRVREKTEKIAGRRG